MSLKSLCLSKELGRGRGANENNNKDTPARVTTFIYKIITISMSFYTVYKSR